MSTVVALAWRKFSCRWPASATVRRRHAAINACYMVWKKSNRARRVVNCFDEYIRTVLFGATNDRGGWYGFVSSLPGREAWAVR